MSFWTYWRYYHHGAEGPLSSAFGNIIGASYFWFTVFNAFKVIYFTANVTVKALINGQSISIDENDNQKAHNNYETSHFKSKY